MTSAVAPRPIAWVTTLGSNGVVNVAPFSWFNSVCADPPILMIAVNERKPGVPKDTVRNIRETGEFVVNVVPERTGPMMVATSADLSPEESEAEAAGVELIPSQVVAPPRIAASPVHFECRLTEEKVLGLEGRARTSMVLGEVVHIGADDAVLDERGNLDPARIYLLGRLGASWYTSTEPRTWLARPGQG